MPRHHGLSLQGLQGQAERAAWRHACFTLGVLLSYFSYPGIYRGILGYDERRTDEHLVK